VPTTFEPQNFFDSALLLTARIDTDLDGESMHGTGFLVQVPCANEKLALALVSNRHVLRDGQGSITIRFHSATESKGVFDLGRTLVLHGEEFGTHYVGHTAPDVDLAAVVVNAVGRVAKGKTLAEEHIATDTDLRQVSCADTVWFVGYPEGWRDELHNLPLVRSGTVASLPRLNFDGRAEFVIDAQVFPGSSGSPVFARIGNQARLVGVVAETAQRAAPVEGPPTILGAFSVQEVMGLGIVIRATQIPRLLGEIRRIVEERVESRSNDLDASEVSSGD